MGVTETSSNEYQRLALIEPESAQPISYFVREHSLRMLFLLDTGATRSILPNGIFKADRPCDIVLQGVTGNTVNVEGKTRFNLEFNLPITFEHDFVVADISSRYGILGADFFEQNKLRLCTVTSKLTHVPTDSSIDVLKSGKNDRAIRKLTADLNGHSSKIMMNILNKLPAAACPVKVACELNAEKRSWETANNFPELFEEPCYRSPPKHRFVLDIDLQDDCPSIYHRPRKASAAERKAIKENFEKLQQQGVVIKNSSNFASPVTVVKKKNGDFRICVDYTKLNSFTKNLNFPLPDISHLQSLLTPEHQWFSTLDLTSAYYSLPMTTRASKRAAIITHEGTFLPLRSPFGLKNSPAQFCELMAEVIEGMDASVFAYLDDFLIFSRSIDEHQRHLEALLTRLRSYGLFLNRDKCKLGQRTVVYLGHELSEKGIQPMGEKIELYANLKPPKTAKELRSLLGIVNYYREHCKDFGQVTSPLNKLLSGLPKNKRAPIAWEKVHQEAFESTIRLLRKAETLSFDDVYQPLIITTDASATHAGAVLEQFVNKDSQSATRPLAYFSQAFPSTTRVRSTFNRELTALYMAARHFRFRIRGREVIFRTDHRSLVNALSNPEGQHSPLERRMIYYLKEYLPTVIFISGEENVVADALSRPGDYWKDASTQTTELVDICAASDHVPPYRLTIPMIVQAQLSDTKNHDGLLAHVPAGEKLLTRTTDVEGVKYSVLGVEAENQKQFRPYLPEPLRFIAFQQLHNQLHQGKEKGYDVLGAHYFWPKLKSDVEKWTKTCPNCQKCKVSRHTRQRLQCYPSTTCRLSTIHVDLMGPLPVSDDYSKYVITIRDRTTGFLISAALPDKSSSSVLQAIKSHFISSFGVPTTIISDNGREFTSNDFQQFCDDLGITHKFVTAYHPQANGLVERVHRSIKVAFRALDEPSSWSNALPFVTLAINNQVCDNNDFTPYQMIFGQAARLPGTFFFYRKRRLQRVAASSTRNAVVPGRNATFQTLEQATADSQPVR